MIVKVPFSESYKDGSPRVSGFIFYCECGGHEFEVRTTEDETVPVYICRNCDQDWLISDFTEAPTQEAPPA